MKTYLTLTALILAPAASAYDFSAAANAVMNNPQVQQAVGQQVMQKAANNPAAVATALGGCATAGTTGSGASAAALGMLGKLSPAQKQQLAAAAKAASAKVFTPTEQKALATFQSSPQGAGVMAKMPALMEQLAPALLQMYATK